MRHILFLYILNVFLLSNIAVAQPCDGNAVAGQAVASAPVVCGSLLLDLAGVSKRNGITYQWQFSTTVNGTFTNIGVLQRDFNSSLLFNPTQSGFYRCIVSCGSSISISTTVGVSVNSQRSGIFSINNALPTSGSNFNSFSDAFAFLRFCSIDGPVVFNVAPGSGPYDEQVTVGAITGVSATNTITINGNGATVRYNAAQVPSTRPWIFRFERTDWIRINNLRFTHVTPPAVNSNAFIGIQLFDDADNHVYNQLVFQDISGINSVQPKSDSITIEQCSFFGGDFGVSLQGNFGDAFASKGNVFRKNLFSGNYFFGIRVAHFKNSIIEENSVYGGIRTLVNNSRSYSGIFIQRECKQLTVTRNKVFCFSNVFNELFGLNFEEAVTATSNEPNFITNNLIYLSADSSNAGVNTQLRSVNGMYVRGSKYGHFYHNTIILKYPTNPSQRGAGFSLSDGWSDYNYLKNNVIAVDFGTPLNSSNQSAISLNDINSNFESDYNNIFITANAFFGYRGFNNNGTYINTLANWQATTTYDDSSITINPFFQSPQQLNFRPTNLAMNDKGTPIGILNDINDSVRSSIKPDIGAYEYLPYLGNECDNGPNAGIALSSNTAGVCLDRIVTLSLSGNSFGPNHRFRWQYSTTSNGTYVNISNDSIRPALQKEISQTGYYRAAVTCNGVTNFSTPVFVQVRYLLAGVYTIDRTLPTAGNNFNSFAEVKQALTCGINGPVTFNIATGVYNDSITFGTIPFLSSANSITFQSATGNPSDVVFNHNGINNYIWQFNSARFISIRNITFAKPSNAIHGRMIVMQEGTSDIQIEGCVFNGAICSDTIANTAFANIFVELMSGTGNLTFKNNTFNNGSFGIYSKAMHHIQNVQPQITLRNNTINNAHGIGIFVESFGNAVVFHNNVNVTSVATSASAAAGIVVMKSLHTDSIIGNKLNIVFPNHIRNGVGISISEAKTNATTTIYPSDVSIVMNNIVRISAPSKSVIGILIKNSYYFNVLHNIVDVNSNHDSTAVLCFVDTLPSLNNMFIRNNIFSNSGGGNVLYIAKDLLFQSASNPSTTQTYTNPSLVSNLYYTVGNAFAKFYHSRTNIDSTITSFTDWRNISSRRFEVEDAGSQFARPPYTSTVDLTPNVTDANIWFINGRAEHLLLPNNAGYWNRDYNGIRRPNYRAEGTLDIGAFEVQPMVAPPLATAIPPVPVANSVQKFVMGVDTIATVQWNANPPSYFYLKQYSGEKPPGINHGAFPYFYYEVDAPRNTNNYNFAYAYHDKWTGHFSPFPNVYDRQYYFALKAIQSQTAGLWSFYYGATSTSIDTQANNMFIARPMRVPIANGSGFYSLALDGVNLPVNFLYINATRNLNNAAIIWYVGDEINLKNYQVERSLNGTNYTAIQSIAAKKSNSYTAIDNAIFQNTNSPFIYYRIKAVNNDGSYTYSKVVTLKVHNKTASLTVNAYPNPFIEQFRIAVFQGELKQANGTIILRAIGGTIVKQLDVKFDVGENYFVIDNLSNLPSGYYLLSVHSNGGILTHLLRK